MDIEQMPADERRALATAWQTVKSRVNGGTPLEQCQDAAYWTLREQGWPSAPAHDLSRTAANAYRGLTAGRLAFGHERDALALCRSVEDATPQRSAAALEIER